MINIGSWKLVLWLSHLNTIGENNHRYTLAACCCILFAERRRKHIFQGYEKQLPTHSLLMWNYSFYPREISRSDDEWEEERFEINHRNGARHWGYSFQQTQSWIRIQLLYHPELIDKCIAKWFSWKNNSTLQWSQFKQATGFSSMRTVHCIERHLHIQSLF